MTTTANETRAAASVGSLVGLARLALRAGEYDQAWGHIEAARVALCSVPASNRRYLELAGEVERARIALRVRGGL